MCGWGDRKKVKELTLFEKGWSPGTIRDAEEEPYEEVTDQIVVRSPKSNLR